MAQIDRNAKIGVTLSWLINWLLHLKNNFFRKINLPVDNEDYIKFVDNIEVVSGQQIAIFLLVIVLIVRWFVLLINKEKIK